MSFPRSLTVPLLAAGLAAASGCAEFNITGAGRATLTYTDDARLAYNEAMESFKARNWEDARALFGEVRKLFAYSRYARLAELRIADIDFEQSKFSDATAGYRDFVQNHRTDPNVEYARYRIAKSLYSDIEDSFILPPAEERAQDTTMSAYHDLVGFVRDYPKSRYSPDVRYMHDVVLQRLVRHELYVARFYLREEAFEATIARIDYALKKYPGSGLDAEALVLKGETLLKSKKRADARAVFEQVVRQYASPFAEAAKSYLADMGPPKPDEKATPATTGAAPQQPPPARKPAPGDLEAP